jgi:hypothetical protein
MLEKRPRRKKRVVLHMKVNFTDQSGHVGEVCSLEVYIDRYEVHPRIQTTNIIFLWQISEINFLVMAGK